MLDEAGYPRGSDGTRFTLKFAQFDRWDPTYAEVILGYFEAIGVKGEIVIQTVAEHTAANKADTHEWALFSGGVQGMGFTALLKPNTPKFSVSQPWVQGYFGESGMGWGERNTFMARLWIDSQLKAEMGR